MKLGGFSLSLTVKNLKQSRLFYENVGFSVFFGSEDQNYLIMKNGEATIGLFQDMFDKNIITFNPGWDNFAKPLDEFEDIRKIQARLVSKGISVEPILDANSNGPASFTIVDPDGNIILFDQHVE